MGISTARKWKISDIIIIILVVLLIASVIGMFVFKGRAADRDAQLMEYGAYTSSTMYELLRHDVRDELVNATGSGDYSAAGDKISLYKKIPYCGYPEKVAATLYGYLYQLEKDVYAFGDQVKMDQVADQTQGRTKLVRTTEVIITLCETAGDYIAGKHSADAEIQSQEDLVNYMKSVYEEQMKEQPAQTQGTQE